MTENLNPKLFSSYSLAGISLKNRIIHASMTTMMSAGGRVTDKLVNYYCSRAKGGAAMLVTEPLAMSIRQAVNTKVHAFEPFNADGLTRIAESVEQYGCRIIGQIQDPGRGRHHSGRHLNAVAPSVLPDDLSWTVPRALSVADIADYVRDFAVSSRRLQSYGFSGVELSCGHGHLFHQFMSRHCNHRTDGYGGTLENRCRFVVEIVREIREKCGERFIIGLKLPGDDGVRGGIGPAEASGIAKYLIDQCEPSYICFAQGAHADSLELHVPDRFGPPMPYGKLTAKLRSEIPTVPLAMLGRITDPAEAEGILARGEAELIALGRPLVADPAWPIKSASNRVNDIRYCLSCNTCWDVVVTRNAPISCVNNPRVGLSEETDYWPAEACASRKKVVVVGAGVAGMEAAWHLGALGHDVLVLSKSDRIGGKAELRSHLPGGDTISSIYDYQTVAAEKAGVKVELGKTGSPELLASLNPDFVVLATGADMIRPDWLPDTAEAEFVQDLRSAMADVLAYSSRQPGTAVIFDMDHSDGTYAAAEYLHELFEKVVVVTPRNTICDDMSLMGRQGVYRRFSQKGIQVLYLSVPVWQLDEIESGRLPIENVYSGERCVIENVAFVSYSTPRARNDWLAEWLRSQNIQFVQVGDCLSPRDLLAATADGHAAAQLISTQEH